jgi:hypothetical protein
MKNLRELDQYRRYDTPVTEMFGSFGDETCGAFNVPYPRNGVVLLVIASAGFGWDHVSVSLAHRCPNWYEMEFVKRMFFKPDETAMQLHVPEKDHLTFAETALHLWRPQGCSIPRPPNELVGAPIKKA